MIQFLPLHAALPAWGEALTAAGFLSAFYGVAIGITQSNPKTVLAYSSVSQMGVIAAVLGMGLAAGDNDVALSTGFYAAHHTLVKGALFLAVGVAQICRAASRVDGAGAGGDSGARSRRSAADRWHAREAGCEGATGRWHRGPACDAVVGRNHVADAALSAPARSDRGARAALPTWRLSLPWLVMAFASVAVPWVLFLTVIGGTVSDALSPAALWSSAWPVLLGALLAFGLRRWGDSLPRVPEGDVVGLIVLGSTHFARVIGLMLERLDAVLREWPVAGVLLLTLVVLLAGLMQIGH